MSGRVPVAPDPAIPEGGGAAPGQGPPDDPAAPAAASDRQPGAARSLPRFILTTLAWLPVAFAVWYFTAPVLLWPAELVAEGVLRGAFPDLVRAVEHEGTTFRALTTLKPGQAVAGGAISVDVNVLLYAYGLPMFASLVLAARERGWPRILLVGCAAMLPFVAWGIVADVLKNVAITAGPAVASQAGFSAPAREAIAFAYQFGSLILPTVVPAAAWVLTHRRFLERLRAPREAVSGSP